MAKNGQDPERAYTLQRLRQEERLLGKEFYTFNCFLIGSDVEVNNDHLNLSNSSSTYELVEEMYDQMSVFDNKMKNRIYSH
jgi:hypothetical protein